MKYICTNYNCNERCELTTNKRPPISCPLFYGKYTHWEELE